MNKKWKKGTLGLAVCVSLLVQTGGWAQAMEQEEAIGQEAIEAIGLEEVSSEQEEVLDTQKESILRQPGFFYTSEAIQELGEGEIQGIAVEGGEYWVALEDALLHYDGSWQLLEENREPFPPMEEESCLGDIEVYDGKVYALVESGKELMFCHYDALTLEQESCMELKLEEAQAWEMGDTLGITIDRDYHLIWVSLGGDEVYQLDLESEEYLGKTNLLDAPGALSALCAYDGWMYFLGGEENDRGLYRFRIDVDKTEAGLVLEESLGSDRAVAMGIDREAKKLLVGLREEGEKEEDAPMAAGLVEIYSMKRNIYPLDYSLDENWVARPEEGEEDLEMDVFFVLPAVNMKNMLLDNEDFTNLRSALRYQKTLAMERGIFEGTARVFSPYYRQRTLGTAQKGVDSTSYEEVALGDIERAFDWFLENHGEDRPFFLFGFSQGAQMIRDLLVKRMDEEISKNLVATYIIGMDVTEETLAANPHLKMAQSASDTGVIISYECVDKIALEGAPDLGWLSINPLNWKTDGTPAEPEENLGMVQVDTSGQVITEQPGYCGAYLDERTGYLVVTGIENPEELYFKDSPVFPDGSYHMYDIFFFYNNLKENIKTRAQAFG